MDVNAVIREIEEQRNFMAARCAKMAGDLADSEQRIASLEGEVAKLRAETGVVELEDEDGKPTAAASAQEKMAKPAGEQVIDLPPYPGDYVRGVIPPGRAPIERMAPMDAFRELARRNGMDPNK